MITPKMENFYLGRGILHSFIISLQLNACDVFRIAEVLAMDWDSEKN